MIDRRRDGEQKRSKIKKDVNGRWKLGEVRRLDDDSESLVTEIRNERNFNDSIASLYTVRMILFYYERTVLPLAYYLLDLNHCLIYMSCYSKNYLIYQIAALNNSYITVSICTLIRAN